VVAQDLHHAAGAIEDAGAPTPGVAPLPRRALRRTASRTALHAIIGVRQRRRVTGIAAAIALFITRADLPVEGPSGTGGDSRRSWVHLRIGGNAAAGGLTHFRRIGAGGRVRAGGRR
jgi:hypothetical protein